MAKIALPLRPGQIVGDVWRVRRALAAGGFAVVFTGRHVETGRDVVIKALRADATQADQAAIRRFERESAVAISFAHPNVVESLAAGQTPDGVPWLVMERLQGKPLSRTMFYSPMSPQRVEAIMRQMLAALAAAHDRGFVHRDLKPSNVFLCEGDVVKLLDFGFVKILATTDDVPGSDDPLTLMGQRVGTPGYMAPEMLKTGTVTPRADLYAVGVLAYELITGEHAFEGEPMELVRAQMERDPGPPLPPVAAFPLYAEIERLFARDPDKRPATAREALARLDALHAPTRSPWFKFWR